VVVLAVLERNRVGITRTKMELLGNMLLLGHLPLMRVVALVVKAAKFLVVVVVVVTQTVVLVLVVPLVL
jgi:hypothetical protein